MLRFNVELTDTFAGEANYAWVKRASIDMPELTHYGYDGSTNYVRANRIFERELIHKAKRALGVTARHVKETQGDDITLKFLGYNVVMFITPKENV